MMTRKVLLLFFVFQFFSAVAQKEEDCTTRKPSPCVDKNLVTDHFFNHAKGDAWIEGFEIPSQGLRLFVQHSVDCKYFSNIYTFKIRRGGKLDNGKDWKQVLIGAMAELEKVNVSPFDFDVIARVIQDNGNKAIACGALIENTRNHYQISLCEPRDSETQGWFEVDVILYFLL